MKEIILSASQLSTYNDCHRKWGFRYLDGVKPPQHPAAELGSRTHEVLAEYLKTGKPPSLATVEGKIALPGIKYLPKPGVAKTEEHFVFETDTAKYQGFIDFEYEQDGQLIIGDHKTTSNFNWALSPGDLFSDIQATIYAKKAIVKSKRASITLRWVYYRTKGRPQAKMVEVNYSQGHLKKQMCAIEKRAHELVSHHQNGLRAHDLKPNLSSCSKYGGCPFLLRCQHGAKT